MSRWCCCRRQFSSLSLPAEGRRSLRRSSTLGVLTVSPHNRFQELPQRLTARMVHSRLKHHVLSLPAHRTGYWVPTHPALSADGISLFSCLAHSTDDTFLTRFWLTAQITCLWTVWLTAQPSLHLPLLFLSLYTCDCIYSNKKKSSPSLHVAFALVRNPLAVEDQLLNYLFTRIIN